jgi:hypothetical protein
MYLNPSFALMEQLARVGRPVDPSVEVPVFLLQGGQTIPPR